jgi:hypothetical protein
MEINSQQTNINFKTNIKFISPDDFGRLKHSILKSGFSKNYISEYKILKTNKKSMQCYRVNNSKCCTTGIRTCVGIMAASPAEKKSSFFAHIFHSNENLRQLCSIKPFINGENAIIIGQRRDKYEASSKIFDSLESGCKAKNMPLTILRGLRFGYETDAAYDGDTDTMFLCVSRIYNKKKYVSNFEKLKFAFLDIKIAPCDNVEFLKPDSIKEQNGMFQLFNKMNNLWQKLTKPN